MYVGGNGVQALEEMAAAGELTVRFRAALSLTPDRRPRTTGSPAAKAERAKHTTTCSRRRPSRSSPTASSRATRRISTSPTPTRSSTRATRTTAASRSGRPTQMKQDVRQARQGRLPDPHARHRRRGHHGDPGRARLRAQGQRQARLAAGHHPHPARRPQGLPAVRQARRDRGPRPVLVHQGRLLHVPPGAVPRPAAGGPRVPDEELLRRRRDRRVARATTRSPSRRTRWWASPSA